MYNILNILPIERNFILVDKIIKLDLKNKFIYSLKNITINEYYIKSHFINSIIMPGSLIIENMAQTSVLLIHYKFNINLFKILCYLSSIEKIKFNFNVFPGDQIITKSFYINKKINFLKFKILSFVKNRLLCSSIMIFNINN